MNLNDYFEPVSLDRPGFSYLDTKQTISGSISIHTPDNPVSDIGQYDIALVGVNEDRNARVAGCAKSPDIIREKFYLLANGHPKLKIIDLGNLKATKKIEDSYFALRDIFQELQKNSVLMLVLGGSEDLSLGLAKAYEKYKGFWNFTSLDSHLNIDNDKNKLSSSNYLNVLSDKKIYPKVNVSVLGLQQYFTPVSLIHKFDNQGNTGLRLGVMRTMPEIAEPILRDTDILSIDTSVLRLSEAPGSSIPSPNGLFAHELCQLARFAGASDKLKAVLFSELVSEKDINDLTAQLLAQAIWYVIDGYSIRDDEKPDSPGIKKFIVTKSGAGQDMVFFKSDNSGKWWMEIPVKDPVSGKKYIVSCAHEDYGRACNSEIPDRWLRLLRKYS